MKDKMLYVTACRVYLEYNIQEHVRYALIDYKRLMDLLHISIVDELRNSHKKWVEEILKSKNYDRESNWSQSIAVGSKSYVEGIKEKLGIRGKGSQGCGIERFVSSSANAGYLQQRTTGVSPWSSANC